LKSCVPNLFRAGVLLLALLGLWLPAQAAAPARRVAALQRGVNVTNWLRFPARGDDAAIGAYVSDAALVDLRHAGFTFVRLPFEPRFAATVPGRSVLLAQVRRLQQAGLAVVLVPSTFPEIVNEPVFPGAASAWGVLQRDALAVIRAALPASTVILSGADWSSVDGLGALTPVADGNVVYTFHFYDPSELTSLVAYRPGLDRAALARLPFPAVTDCARAAASPDPATQNLVAFVCAQHWDEAAIIARTRRCSWESSARRPA
jgi:hypothetical protein